jgi:tetratricopeptide (TPR) repeat protein
LCLILDEAPKYRDACKTMVGKFGEADRPMAANFVAWSCALAPHSLENYAPVLACATKAVEAQPKSDQFLNTMGAILYRAGRHEDAIEWLTELDRSLEDPSAEASSSPAYTWYFLTMVHKKAGNEDEARLYFSKANDCTDDALADEENPPRWNRRATLELLREEAEELLAARDVEPSDQKEPQPPGDVKLSLSGLHQWVLHCRRARRFAAEGNWSEAASAFSEALKLRPDDWELWRGRGEAHEKLDQWEHTIADYRKAIELKPEKWPFWKGRAESFAQSEQSDRAMALYTSLLKHNSDNWRLWKARGGVHEKLDQWDKAIGDYQKAIELEPKEWRFWKARADNLAQSGQRDKAIALYTSLLKHNSDNGELWQARAIAYGQLKQWDKAIEDYDEATKLQPDDCKLWTESGEAHAQAKQWAEARVDLDEAIRLDPTRWYAYAARAQAHARMGVYDRAIADCNEASRLNPTNWFVYAQRAEAHTRLGNCDQAIADYNEASRLNPTNWRVHAQRAEAHTSLGNYDQAIADYNEAIRLAPENPDFYAFRAEAYSTLGRYDKALADCNRYVELRPDDAVAALIPAQMLLMANRTEEYRQACEKILDRFGQSEDPLTLWHTARACVLAPNAILDPIVPVELAERAVSCDPRGEILNTLGMAHLRAGQLDEAARRFHESLDTHPDWGGIFLNWLGLALVHHERGETQEARRRLGEAIESMEQRVAPAIQARIQGQLLRRELEQLLGKPKQEKHDIESEQKAPVAEPKPTESKAATSELSAPN